MNQFGRQLAEMNSYMERDAAARVCRRLKQVFLHDQKMRNYLEDLARSFLSNDAVAELRALRNMEQHISNDE